jgi:hypothetical protein
MFILTLVYSFYTLIFCQIHAPYDRAFLGDASFWSGILLQ